MLVIAVSMAIVLALNALPVEGVVVEGSQLQAPDNATYYEVLEEMNACEMLSGIKLSWPLDDKATQQRKLCDLCVELRARINQYALPVCIYEPASTELEKTKLSKQLRRLFRLRVGTPRSRARAVTQKGSSR